MMFARTNNLAAFTLIELLMVMVLITILVGAVAPKLVDFAAGRRSDNAAQSLVAYARDARTEAISEGRLFRLNLDPSGRQFWLTAQDPETGQYVAPTGEFSQKYDLPDGVTMTTDIAQQSDGCYVTFHPSGLVDLGATQGSAPAANSQGAGGVMATPPPTAATGTPDTLQAAKVELTDARRHVITVDCQSETELFHVVQPGEEVP
jgi:prepilin-type N-terminal cleavage/methylation domain-containing protein